MTLSLFSRRWAVLASAAFFFVLFQIESPSAFADIPLPKPLEDVTKLEKPTLSFMKVDPVQYDMFQIWLVDADGENERLWMDTGGKAEFSSVEWSPDGKRAAIFMRDSTDYSRAPYILDLETGRATNLAAWTPLPVGLTFRRPCWSPDGRWLAMDADGERVDDLYKLNVNTRKLVRLTNMPSGRNMSPRWSPDGQKIVFLGASDTKKYVSDVYTMDAKDGKNRVNLTQSNFSSENALWSTDGRWIAFSANRVPNLDQPYSLQVYAMRPDGSDVEALTFNDGADSPDDWSPDGKWLLYSSSALGKGGNASSVSINMMHIDTKEVRHVLDLRMKPRPYDLSPRWVMAGKSRFLSANPADKKHGQSEEADEADAEPQKNDSGAE